MATEAENQVTKLEAKETQEEISVELPAPEGWKKKFTPLNKGGTPNKNAVTFISPTGEQITNKRQLGKYLKDNVGTPSLSQFDWSTGDTPRRSSRISEKSKATDTPESEPLKKRERKSSSKKGVKESILKEGEAQEEVVIATNADADAKLSVDADMKDAEGKENDAEKVSTGKVRACETKEQVSEYKNENNVENKEREENLGDADTEMISDTMEVTTEKGKVAQEAPAEGTKVDEEDSVKEDHKVDESVPKNSNQASLKEEDKVGENLPCQKDVEESSEPKAEVGKEDSVMEDPKVDESVPENSNQASLKEEDCVGESLPEKECQKDVEEGSEPKAEVGKEDSVKEDPKVGESLPEKECQMDVEEGSEPKAEVGKEDSVKEDPKVDGSVPQNSSQASLKEEDSGGKLAREGVSDGCRRGF